MPDNGSPAWRKLERVPLPMEKHPRRCCPRHTKAGSTPAVYTPPPSAGAGSGSARRPGYAEARAPAPRRTPDPRAGRFLPNDPATSWLRCRSGACRKFHPSAAAPGPSGRTGHRSRPFGPHGQSGYRVPAEQYSRIPRSGWLPGHSGIWRGP